jgi:hypothetical protein
MYLYSLFSACVFRDYLANFNLSTRALLLSFQEKKFKHANFIWAFDHDLHFQSNYPKFQSRFLFALFGYF